MKVATWNVNGVRKRLPEVVAFIANERPDVVCLQETKALTEQIPEALRLHEEYWGGFHGHKGYSGVALLLRKESFPDAPTFEHPSFDYETRVIGAKAGDRLFVSMYAPNGGKDFGAKMKFLRQMVDWGEALREGGQSLILCGDLNVARTDMDVHPTERKRIVGQLPEERALIEAFLGQRRVDLVRSHHPDDDRLFSWWAPWREMRQRNIGWRLDYVVASDDMAERATRCDVQTTVGTSDHAPVIATFA